MPTRKRATDAPAAAAPSADDAVRAIRHRGKRKNIPPAGLEAQGRVQEAPRVRYEYNPHLPPILRFADDPAAADRLPHLLATARERALSADEAAVLAAALRRHEPWLEWAGKRERPWFDVEPPALHLHERVSTQAILRVLAREDVNRDLFADPQQSYAEAVQFYQHDVDWSNRMILGDSLSVMASLARREDLAGKVQMIYIDPPYGISFKSNFQPALGQRDVKDREQDLTREPEMVKAYRDTWTLGIHSYLAYLRDRLMMGRVMTTDPGDLVLDPTCGSGTTAFVAEKWGRRWITVDSSRVALALAKHRLMTASFEHFNLRLHMALIRPDVAMGDLLKLQPGSQLFMVFSAPRVKPPQRLPDGQFSVEVEGMDIYDPVSNSLFPTGRDRIAAWFVDTDHDGRSGCLRRRRGVSGSR